MSNHEDYTALQTEIEAIEEKGLRYPTMPMGIYLQEAEDLYHWVQADKDSFGAVGFAWADIEKLPTMIGAARYAQSQWNSTRFTKEEAQKEYNERSPHAYDLRDRLVHHMLFAYRGHSDLMERVRAIAEGSGEAASDKEVKINRDKAFTLLKKAVDEVRDYGRYIFWRDEARKYGYASDYRRRTRSPSKPTLDLPLDLPMSMG